MLEIQSYKEFLENTNGSYWKKICTVEIDDVVAEMLTENTTRRVALYEKDDRIYLAIVGLNINQLLHGTEDAS